MQFQAEQSDGVQVITVPRMDLDASNADEFKRDAAPLVEGHPSVVLDFGGVGFMDSAGLGAVLSVYKKVRSEGGRFGVFGLSPEVSALFDLVRMRRLFDVYADKEAAIRESKP